MGLMALEIQFNVYIMHVSSNNKFSGLKEIKELIRKIIDTKKNKLHLLIYLLMISVLILPITTLY